MRHDVLRDAIVEAFATSEEVERFAHVAEIEEIATNDSNLNTAEPIEVPAVEKPSPSCARRSGFATRRRRGWTSCSRNSAMPAEG